MAAAISKAIRDSALTSGAEYPLNNTVNTNITARHPITSLLYSRPLRIIAFPLACLAPSHGFLDWDCVEKWSECPSVEE
jgi:hypothetical protein